MSLWKDFANKMKNKRAEKGKNSKDSKKPLKDELIVQRMSSDVSGRAQKYSRIGPREFFSFRMYEELTLENITLKNYITLNTNNFLHSLKVLSSKILSKPA